MFIAAHAEVRNTETLEEEGAWGKGTRFVERGPWATYFTYTVQASFNCVEADGVEVGGACWFLGASGASCTDTCGLNGLVYYEATRSYAGDLGTRCTLAGVLVALGLPSGPVDNATTPLGCAFLGGFLRIGFETTAAWSEPGARLRVRLRCAGIAMRSVRA